MSKPVSEWSMLVYMAADNSLAPFASKNIDDMVKGLTSTKDCNVLVQWDKPHESKTWRYQVTPKGAVDVGSLDIEMGHDQTNELIDSMKWVMKEFPAKKYALVLWNHGSGIEDFLPDSRQRLISRGILYDDTQQTCLTNQGLSNALSQIKQTMGHNLDLIAMDACLMAMTEVAYQMKDSVNLFVASEQTIPGNGYPYSRFLNPLSKDPAGSTPLQLATNMVDAYGDYYTHADPTHDHTISLIDITQIGQIKQNIDRFIDAVSICSKIDAKVTKNIVIAARRATLEFAMPEYIDLYSFYANMLAQIKKVSPRDPAIAKSAKILGIYKAEEKSPITPALKTALATLTNVLNTGVKMLTTVVLKCANGPVYAGAKGISIYYPTSGDIDESYSKTMFANDTGWVKFIMNYKS